LHSASDSESDLAGQDHADETYTVDSEKMFTGSRLERPGYGVTWEGSRRDDGRGFSEVEVR
jgi:hypothetical protein